MNMTSVIPPGASEACVLLLAVEDEVVEDNEVFTITVETADPSDTVNGSTSIVISDNDGKQSVYNIIQQSEDINGLHRCEPHSQ